MLTFALFGAGRIGRLHAANIASHANARLAAVADTVPAAAEELADGFSRDPVLHFFLERYGPACRAELDAFVDAVANGRPPAPTGEDGLAALRLADSAQKSLETGLPVRL